MLERRVTVTNRLGLHARAAAQLVRAANLFQCDVRLEHADKSASADAKSILSVLMLAAARGTQLIVTTHGVDEEQALNHLCTMFADGFGEEKS